MKFRHGLFLILLFIGAGLYARPLMEVAALTRQSELYSHIPLIPMVSAYFLFVERKRIFSNVGWAWLPGGITLAAGLVVSLIGRLQSPELNQNDYLSTMMLGLVIWIAGGFLTAYGFGTFKQAMFSLFFLVFLIPVPKFILDPYVTFLQHASADSAYLVFKVTGVPFYREGLVFSLPGATIEVATQCSGIRSSLALIITGVVAGKLFLERPWSKVVLVLAVLPVTIFKNSLRIVTLSILGAYVNPAFLTGHWLHRSGGIPFFVFGLLLLAPVLWGLRRVEKKRLLGSREAGRLGGKSVER